MATVALVPDVMTEAGLAETVNAGLSTANTYTVRNNGKTFLHVKNTGGTACVVTINAPGTIAGHALAAGTVTVPITTGDKLIGPFPSAVYDDVNHDVSFTLSFITGVTVAVVQLP
jgi:hypothetical protein